MEYLTLADIRLKVEEDLDMQGEDFVQSGELLGYINAGIDEAESEIHTTYEDYFLAKAELDLVNGTEEYSLPSNIFANKIRCLIYKNSNIIYEIKRMRSRNAFLMREMVNLYPSSSDHSYMITNSSGTSKPKILLVPPAQETRTSGLVLWYIRNANKLVLETDSCDIPEFVEFVIQFAKCEVLKKEGHPNLQTELIERERLRKLMIDTLSNMVPDGDNTVEMDLSHYEEMN